MKEEIFKHLQKKYKENKEEFLKEGITSFSGFITKYLTHALDDLEDREDLKSHLN